MGRRGPKGRPVVWEGTTYPSVTACALALGIARKTVRERLRRLADPSPPRAPRGRPGVSVVHAGVTYPSWHACARALGIDWHTVERRQRRGVPLDQRLGAQGRHKRNGQ